MAITLIDKIKQQNDGDFKLLDASDLEFDSAAKTIATGVITQSDDAIWNIVDTEGAAASDDLATVTRATKGPNSIIISPASGARTVVIKHGTGNILCMNNADITLDDIHDFAILYYDGSTNWYAMSDTTGGGGVADGDKGDVTVSASGATWTVDNDAITYAKIQNVSATDKVLGRSTAGSGDVEEIACTATGRSILDDASIGAVRTTIGVNHFSYSVTVKNPTSSEDISIAFTNRAITITEMRAVLNNGTSTPSVTWTIRHYATDRSNAGNQVVTGGTTTTSVSTGSDVTAFNDATIPADSYIWLETTAKSGTVPELAITIIGTID